MSDTPKGDKPAIEVCDVTFHYETWPVLKNIALSVAEGESVVLMGPNGMGKTTLLEVIAGLLHPVKGHVTVNGRRRRESEEAELAIRGEVFYLPERPWLPSDYSVIAFLMGVGRAYGVPEAELIEHAPRLLRLFYLDDVADDSIDGLSTGQKKKLGLAAALAARRPILIIDEPFSGGLDPAGLAVMREVLSDSRANRKRTVLMATPVAELVEEVVDRVVILDKGRVLAEGSPEELRRQAGDAESLSDAVERLMSPDTEARISEYFEGERP